MPIFALANAGVRLDGETLSAAMTSPISIGVALGLFAGKLIGITAGTWLPLRLNWGFLPGNLVWGQLLGGAAVSGIGFTVSLFIVDLAFDDPLLISEAKIGILAGSLMSALLGWVVFKLAWNRGGVCAPPDAPANPRSRCRCCSPPRSGRTTTRAAPRTRRHPGRVRRLRVPLLRPPPPDPGRAAAAHPDLRIVFRHFPQRTLHPRAVPAALVAEAAAAPAGSGRCTTSSSPTSGPSATTTWRATRPSSGRPVGADAERAARIERDERSGRASGARGTPTLFINGVRYQGGLDLQAIIEAVEQARPRLPYEKAP